MATGHAIIAAGDLDQRVQLLAPSVVEDELGQRVETFVLQAAVWAKVLTQISREAVSAQAVQGQANIGFRIRWRAGVLPTWRVQWRGQRYEVLGDPIDVKGARVALDLMCRSLAVPA